MKASDLIEFLEIPTGDAFDVSADRAIAYFRAKGLRSSYSYADTLGAANDRAFTIAKMMDVDLLRQVRDSLDSALANGTSFREWSRELEPVLQKAGWWGVKPTFDPLTGQTVDAQLGAPWRLETIFRTNMQSAYASGQWQEIQAQAEAAPFLLYDAVDDFRTRALHRAWDNTCLPVSSPWWNSHFPPNGWNCRCGVIQLDAEELQRLGISTEQDPPADGTYKWTNPRTGEVSRIPNGIDPGWNRNSGRGYSADLQQQLLDKVQQLPPDMQAAVDGTLRRSFDTNTEAGRWHAESFDYSAPWVRDAVLSSPSVEVEYGAQGAYASMGRLINMGGRVEKAGEANRSVWRHEYGHILDWRLQGEQGLYRSSFPDFHKAQTDDAIELIESSAKGRKSKRQQAQADKLAAEYGEANRIIVDTDRGKRRQALEGMAEAAGIELEQFLGIVRASTLILEEGIELESIGTAARLARMLKAIELKDAEGFLKFASFKDDPELWKETGKTWRKDGALSALSDLIGSATRNKVASYNDGFPGHSDRYYGSHATMQGTESFANLMSLSGHELRPWWELVRRFTPRMADLFEQIMLDKGKP